MTAEELKERAILLLAAGGAEVWLDAEVEVGLAIPYAYHDLAVRVSRDPARFGLLQQTYSVAVSSGVGNLLTATGAITLTADMLWDSAAWGHVKDADGTKLVYVPEQSDFEGYLLPGLKYFTLTHQRITARSAVTGDYTSDLGDVVSPLTVTANFIPSIGTLPAQLDDDLVATLARIVATKMSLPIPK